MVLREPNDPLSQSRGIMGPLGNSAVQNNRGRLRQRFDLIRKLGQGTYGKVQLGIDKETGQEVAIKTIKKSKIETEADLIRIRREIQIMSSVRHPNIIHIYEVFENREKMVLVMEYAAGGELYDYLNDRKILQEDEARRIFRQIASAVYYCHKHKICHRDLKLENILLDESANAKIADFGLSNVFDDVNLLKTFCGSPLYASPEIVRGTPYYGPEVDCWSLGVLLYTLVYGAMPFDGSNFKRLVKQISNGDYYEPKKPAEASLLIRRMLTVDPVKRASIKDVCAHQWINQGFDKECLSTAEELANQTPVRLDVLLSVAPAYNINHSQVVIACDQGDGDNAVAGASGGAVASGNAAAASCDSLIAVAEPKKAKKDAEQPGSSKPGAAPMEKPARPSLHKEKEKQPPAQKEVKRKAAVKKKSKSSPVLELIVDEEEEMDKLEPLEIIDGSPEDDDDAGDTLSEISEIQTIAEDIKDMAKSKSKLKVKAEEQKKEPAKEKPKEEPVKEKTVQQAEAPPATPTVVKEVRKKSKTEAEPKVTESKEEKQPPKTEPPKEAAEVKPQKATVQKIEEPKEPEPTPPKAAAEPASKASTETGSKPPAVKKKLVKKASVDKVENKAEEDKNKSSTKSMIASSTTGSSSSIASSVGGKSGTKSDRDSKSEAGSKPKLRARSDSLSSDASPTRIERRNSKVISQKTAELIQNLETKQSLGSTDGTKPKKLVFPSLKVSDAKRAFEKPPKPVKEPSSPPVKKSPTEDKAAPEFKKPEKPEGSELTVAKPKKPKSKSPSPIPDEAKQKSKTGKQTESKTVEGKIETSKDAEPQEVKVKETVKEKPAVVTKPAIAPKPTEKVKETKEPEKSATLAPSENQTAKQKSVSPKPKRKIVTEPVPEPPPPSQPVPSPEPPSEMTVSDSLNTEIDRTVSEVPKKVAPKPLKKLKIPTPAPSPVPNPDQLVKPVLVDNGSGTPKQAVMLMHGRTTPPVKNSADLDTSMSTDPFFSQTESISISLPKDKVKPASKPHDKQQAAKKISSVISRIASSESAERIMNEDKKGKKVVKSEVEKFVNAPDSKSKTQRTEVSFPVAAAPSAERIIPIRFEDDVAPSTPPTPVTTHPHINVITQSSKTQSAPNISRMPLRKSVDASSSTLFSRQNSSDTESSIAPPCKPEPIRKSPREFIIPIKLETSGQTVTPKDDASEASQSEDPFRIDSRLRSGRFGRHKRYSSLLSDSSLEEEPAASTAPTTSVSASTSRRSSAATAPCHARSHSQGDEPDTPTTPLGTFKKYRMRRAGGLPLDRSDSFSSAEEDEEDAFEVLTAESLFSSLLDRVRNLTKRINRDEGPNTNWQGPESPGFMFGTANPFREFMSRAPSETRSFASSGPTGSYTMTRSFSREPSVTVTISTGPTWRRSLSREMSGGSMFHSRGSSFAGADPMDTCTVRSLPLNLNSRRAQFLSQRSEPHGIPDSPLTSYSTPPARPYGRTMSNTDYNTSVTLPIRRSVKTYDRPSVYGHNDYSDNYTPLSSTSSMNYNTPSRSNSLMSRYTGSASNSVASAGGISEPPYSRFSRSVSRARTTPDADIPRFRDISATRQLDNPLLSSYRNPGESNGWVGGSNSSSVKTAAATAKMTTQEKMNNYQNYYQGLSQNPLRSFPESTSPTPFLETFTDNFASPNSAFARRSPVYETSYIDTQLHSDSDLGLAPSKIIRPVKPVSPSRSFTTRELSSPPMLVKPADPAPTNIPKWPSISVKTHRPVNVANFTDGNLNQNPHGDSMNSTTPLRVNTSRSIPSIVNRASVENPMNSVLPGSPQTVSTVASPQPPSLMSVATMRPQNPTTFRVLSPPPTNPNPVTEVPKTSPTGPPITGYNKIPRRDARATSVEKITRLLERKSMPRERVVSPPPQISPPTPNHIEMSRTPEAVSPSSTLTLKSEEDASDRSLNASPEKFRNISNSNSLQRIGKPKFLQNLEKKWEKLTSPSPQSVREFEKPSRKEEPAVIMPQDSSDESEAQTKPDSESMLLQRAVSPEKKLRSKFGASTVNYMLGKFKRFEESSSGSKIPAGKPPVGSLSNSKIGRRVQSVYAGACSDSVLTLPRETTPSPVITNGIPDPDKAGHVANPSKSRISPRLERAATVITNAVPNPASAGQLLREADTDDSKQKPHLVRRPVSLGIFSGGGNNASSSNNTINPSNTNPSLIPRFNRNATPQRTLPSSVSVDNERTPINECPTPVTEAPQIHIIPDSKISDDPDDNLLTPTSISDSFDSSSICSEKTEMSKSVLDDEESVSDRIFRKSFYPRFNSLDRKKSKSTPSNPRHYTPKVGKSPVVARSSLSPSNNFHESLVNNFVGNSLVAIPAPNSMSSISPVPPTCSSTPSPTTVGLSSKINKYNPNPLFKELITDDFKTEVGSKAEYSRRVTSKLSKLLKEIESDIGSSGATTSSQNKDMTNNLKNSLSAGSNAHIGKNRKSLSPIPGRFIDTSQQQTAVERSGSTKSNNVNLSNNSDSAGKNG